MKDKQNTEELEIPDKSSETVLTNQVSMYQHFQKVSTNLLNIIIGAFTLVVTAFGTGYLELPQYSPASVENSTFYTSVNDETMGLIKLSGSATSALTVVIIILLVLSTLALLASILWPEDMKPIFGSENESMSIVRVTDSNTLETYLEDNREILREMSEKQSDGYKSLGIAAGAGILLLYLLGSLVEGNYNTILYIYIAGVLPSAAYIYNKSNFGILSIIHTVLSYISFKNILKLLMSPFVWMRRNLRNLWWFGTRTYIICAILGTGILLSKLGEPLPLTEIRSDFGSTKKWYSDLPIHSFFKQYVVFLFGVVYLIMVLTIIRVGIGVINSMG